MTPQHNTLPAPALLSVFKALAHESRLKLLAAVAERAHSVQELAQRAGLTEPTTSHHLAILKEAGLVSVRPEGTTHWYALEPRALPKLNRDLFARPPAGQASGDADAPKVVRNYLNAEGRLKIFPAQRGKRWHILVWLARHFEEGGGYKEKEGNAILSRRHHDFETFRRERVMHRMFARDKGVYWRLPESEWKGA